MRKTRISRIQEKASVSVEARIQLISIKSLYNDQDSNLRSTKFKKIEVRRAQEHDEKLSEVEKGGASPISAKEEDTAATSLTVHISQRKIRH